MIKKVWSRLKLDQCPVTVDLLFVLLVVTFVYRVRLIFYLFHNVTGYGVAEDNIALGTWSGIDLFSDIIFLVGFFIIFRFAELRAARKENSLTTRIFQVNAFILLVLIPFAYGSHFAMLNIFQAGLRLEFVLEVLILYPFDHFFAGISIGDWSLVFVPLLLYLGLRKFTKSTSQWKKKIILGVIAFAFLNSVVGLGYTPQKTLPEDVRRNPWIFFMVDSGFTLYQKLRVQIQDSGLMASKALHKKVMPAQYESIKLIDSHFVHEGVTPGKLVPGGKKKWNFVFIILESTGFEYIFDTSMGNEPPMPFVKKLSEQSLFLQKHTAVSNSSPRSIFSIFSGMYPDLALDFFSLKKNNQIPSLATFLNEQYDKYLVTPFYIKYYFPRHFLRNSGLKDLYGFENIPEKPGVAPFSDGRNENDAIDFFLEKLEKTREPFFATYYSYVPHYPYRDYGKKYEILADSKKRIHRYYNNLRMLDTIVERIYKQLEESGKLKNTILVLVGDHSEAFGQHEGNWIHSLAVYNENLHVPVIFYQPDLFRPRKINYPTSHVDVLPTVLDAARIDYNDELIQGESMFQNRMRRKYVFAMGIEDSIASIDARQIKMIVNYQKNTCEVFNLKNDPGEFKPLACESYPEQRMAIEAMRDYQPTVLHKYNTSLTEDKSFGGKTHPY
ncbi:MAG: sulfatase-like hydrolase/transferase [Leptospirales bacterium]